MTERDAFAALQAENARLVASLESHGVAWRAPPAAPSQPAPPASAQAPVPEAPHPSLSTVAKVALFRRLFRGRTDDALFQQLRAAEPAVTLIREAVALSMSADEIHEEGHAFIAKMRAMTEQSHKGPRP